MSTKEIIKNLLRNKNMTIAELERALGFSNGTIGKWDKQNPSIDKLTKVADYFNVTTDYLLDRNNTPEWATKKDILDLRSFLEADVNMAFNGSDLSNEEMERVQNNLINLYWKIGNEMKGEKEKRDNKSE
ncbi:helix-turn-helix transcriptional regulator [Carnobacterium maltaromaticum]|uniref:Helix-turn-helix transcriptional regulator n=1 Tax=Carnobacterium maltaromaticum TaxID=2751 RepID=A0AAW9K881_CARML|nr:helix-turn-helix transcriptional regulator [Carnobacterium maltaromaticum]MDZ5759662.1 helix-turn-helix transcriptional regulator [Carnobacterium maltaromaticum]